MMIFALLPNDTLESAAVRLYIENYYSLTADLLNRFIRKFTQANGDKNKFETLL